MSIVSDLLAEIDAFLEETGLAETTFGLLALNDGKFVGRLRSGAGVTVKTIDRVRAYIAEQREAMVPPPPAGHRKPKAKAA